MARQPKGPVANCVDHCAMVLVISHYERTSDAVSTRASGTSLDRLASIGVTKRLHQLVADGDPRSRNHQAPVGLDEHVIVDGNDPQRCPVCGQLDAAWPQPQLIAQGLRDDQTACLING